MNILDLLPAYKVYLEHERRLAPNTVYAYLYDLRELHSYTSAPVSEITLATLRAYQTYMSQSREFSLRTIERKFAGFATFWKWLHMEKHVQEVITERIRIPKQHKRVPVWLTEEELRTFANTEAETLKETVAWKCLAWLGIRRGELLNMRAADIRLSEKLVIIRSTKNKTERTMWLSDALCGWLAKQIEGKESGELLFPGDMGGNWSKGSFTRAFHEHVKRCGLTGKRITPRTLRHTFATLMIRKGVSITDVQKLLGHRDIKNTMVYAHTSDARLRLAMSRHVLNERTED